MLQTLARRHRGIAWFFVALFYLQLVLVPAMAKANMRPLPYRSFIGIADPGNTFRNADSPFTSDKIVASTQKITATPIRKKEQSPVKVKGTFTTGPGQPEMQSFQSVNANNLVDLFSGDFSYNIPLLDVGGYPVNLHYQSGITMDQDASWVGLGWNINPGTITRNMRGLPDDFMGEKDKVTKTVSVKDNRTVGVTIGANAELIGANMGTQGLSLGVFHNTYKGWGTETGLNANINSGSQAHGPLSGSLSITNNSQNGLDVSPSLSYKMSRDGAKENGSITIGTNYNSRFGVQSLQINGGVRYDGTMHKRLINSLLGNGVSISFSRPSYTPSMTLPYTSTQISFTAKVGFENWALHPNFYVRGYASRQEIKASDRTLSLPAYGYLYYEKAGRNQSVLLDFNREKDIPYSENTPNIAIPIYTYDTYSITGEGTGGMFRPYRGDVGYIYDHAMTTKSNSNRFSLDVGFGNVVHGGVDFNTVYAATKNNPWLSENRLTDVIRFREKDTTYENVYFKNPGEKTAVNKAYLQAIGDDTLMRIDLSPMNGQNHRVVTASRNASLFKGGKVVGSTTFDLNTVRSIRDKRTQVISYLNATEAGYAGLDKMIRSYGINTFPSGNCIDNYDDFARTDNERKSHHLSEMNVLNADGRRYVYGIPVYNKSQVDVSMATQKGNNASGLVKYEGKDNSVDNPRGKDGYMNRESLPSYAHSFLLTGILSTDYVDLTGDGISDDDNGDAVKFNYSRIYDAFKWRAPFFEDSASFNEGLKSDTSDDRGSFSYGEREVWYLNSVESKTMMATFVLETDHIRLDAYGVKSENGGRNDNQKLYRLKEINLYAKSDYHKNGIANAKPIKTVHFEYSYELCKKNPGSVGDTGKLTLKKVWFSYNKNFKGKRNPYVFTYHATNPSFSSKSVDRWGQYKNPADNPGATGNELSNADYPYTLQTDVKAWDSAKAANNAAPWTLTEIGLPSGGKIKVTYESDDYAYVQNKRAMQFFSLAGFGGSPTATVESRLYPFSTAGNDYQYVFFNIAQSVNSREDIQRKYLDGVKYLYFKLAVNMPKDARGGGFELIPVYAEIEDYGIRNNSSNKVIWIRVKPIKTGESPFATAALQFVRLNLPHKAFPFSEPGDNITLKDVSGMLASIADNIKNSINGFAREARRKNLCISVVTDKSFVRLDNPTYKKLGGGLRVKKVELYDNWNAMTGQKQSVYGQTYDYSTTIDINGVKTRISSGVATYEPAIGNDENPFRVPQKLYTVKVGALIPADNMYTEDPFAETFFPAPMVGYSKVKVQTIHNNRKSANGFEETEFYTTKDFPVLVEYTPLDDASRKRYNPAIANAFKFDARNYITLSQGFKVELNDMNGKMKSQASYAQNEPTKPLSYTYNYYRIQNDNAAQPVLSNKVAVVDSANGIIDTAGEIGKEVELMIDVREQTSTTIGGSLEVNVDVANWFPPVILGSAIPLPSMETNRYRAIAVLKVVNRYGILDSVLHREKGSTVTTRNMLYDSETGDVLLSQTNNEFDDPVYNFNYPAHWAYSGMGLAYRNIGTVLKGVKFRSGMLYSSDGQTRLPAERYFESGDEILVYGQDKRSNMTNDHCSPYYYFFNQELGYTKIWAVDASRGKEGEKGIYFIDKDGIPYSANSIDVKIIRSGRRNMPATSIGSVTSLASPVKSVNDAMRLVFDSTTNVLAASAGRFRDFWKVDSTGYKKDTTIIGTRSVYPVFTTANAVSHYTIADFKPEDGNRNLEERLHESLFEASSFDGGSDEEDEHKRSWLKFDMSQIPAGAVIQSANLYLFGANNTRHADFRNTNSCVLDRVKATWPRDIIPSMTGGQKTSMMVNYFWDPNESTHDYTTRVTLPSSEAYTYQLRNDTINITGMAQAMLNDYHTYNGTVAPAIRIRLSDPSGGPDWAISRLSYNTEVNTNGECALIENTCTPYIAITYYPPCTNGTSPTPGVQTFASIPGPAWYCHDDIIDTFLCKPTINDTAVNFYRVGILGNWRLDRAYTYYGSRMQSDPAPGSETNIRTDGAIKSFMPYWNFTNALLSPSADTMRWVWNSEMTLFNNKGFEIENHDPLDRYNAGQYGYNKTLPVAVGQNTKNREMVFDGFEDYGYSTETCPNCNTARFFDMEANNLLVDTVSHSGIYSLRLNGNQSHMKVIPIETVEKDTISEKLSMKVDSTPLVNTIVSGNGTGLGNYYYTINGGCYPYNPNNPPQYTGVNSNVNYDINGTRIPNICGSNRDQQLYYSFNGFIQPRYTGAYKFYVTADDISTVYITRNGVTKRITVGSPVEQNWHNKTQTYATDTIVLQAGELYPIQVLWDQYTGPYRIKLEWESLGQQVQSREIVPVTQLYPVSADPATVKANTVVKDTTWCLRFENPTGENVINNKFSPIDARKIVVSAWVKQESPCVNGNYDNVQMTLNFKTWTTVPFVLKPAGNIIDGWQRIEGIITIPETSKRVEMLLQSTSATPVYFDDIRIHPFNANMKSFVYHPVNLRLMAELDENNYATFYEYDDDGTLIRVKKETERGVKTVKETRSALLKQ
jgi:hypothetical protein